MAAAAPQRRNENISTMSSTLSRNRLLVTTCIIIPSCWYYFPTLVSQMEGSIFKASLIVGLAITLGILDLNDMSGQPEDDHHDD